MINDDYKDIHSNPLFTKKSHQKSTQRDNRAKNEREKYEMIKWQDKLFSFSHFQQ